MGQVALVLKNEPGHILGDRKMNKTATVVIIVLAGLLLICVIALSVTNKRLNLERQEKTRLEAELNALSEELRALTSGAETEGKSAGRLVEGQADTAEETSGAVPK